MGMSSAIASTSSEGSMQKAPVIHRTALCCIFLNSNMFLIIEVLL